MLRIFFTDRKPKFLSIGLFSTFTIALALLSSCATGPTPAELAQRSKEIEQARARVEQERATVLKASNQWLTKRNMKSAGIILDYLYDLESHQSKVTELLGMPDKKSGRVWEYNFESEGSSYLVVVKFNSNSWNSTVNGACLINRKTGSYNCADK